MNKEIYTGCSITTDLPQTQVQMDKGKQASKQYSLSYIVFEPELPGLLADYRFTYTRPVDVQPTVPSSEFAHLPSRWNVDKHDLVHTSLHDPLDMLATLVLLFDTQCTEPISQPSAPARLQLINPRQQPLDSFSPADRRHHHVDEQIPESTFSPFDYSYSASQLYAVHLTR